MTFAAWMIFSIWRVRLKRQLTDTAIPPLKLVSDLGIVNDFREELKREQVLRELPKQQLFKYRVVVLCSFLFFAMLIAEVLVLQR
jgi:hypothetical protein